MQKPILSKDKKKMKFVTVATVVLMLFVVASAAMWTGFMMKEVSDKPESLDEVLEERSTSYNDAQQYWDLTFHDEFNNGVLSHGYWTPNGIEGGDWWTAQYVHGTGNAHELQYYTRYDTDYSVVGPHNLIIDDHDSNFVFDTTNGILSLVVREEPGLEYIPGWWSGQDGWTEIFNHPPPDGSNHCWYGGYDYTSGWIETAEYFLYGKFEICCKIPNDGQVLWPAFWLYNGGGQNYREIDIFEFGASSYNCGPNTVLMNLHIAEGGSTYNSYGDVYIIQNPPGVSDAFHTYAVRWTPNIVAWYVDNELVYSLTGHTPHKNMRIIANLAIAPWMDPTGNPCGNICDEFPYYFEIDYIRAYRSQSKEFMWKWGNNGSGAIDGWNMHSDDVFVSGDFDGDNVDEVLAVCDSTSWSKVLSFDEGLWSTSWHNSGDGKIDGWNMHSDDVFVSGDFDGDGADEVLAVADNGWSKVLSFDDGSWSTSWHNGGANTVDGWCLNPGDVFVSGDFDGDGVDEVLAVCDSTSWSKVLSFDDGSWSTSWHNSGSGAIDGWNMHSDDVFISGDFDGDGVDEVLAVCDSTSWSKVLSFDGGSWSTSWHNSGSGAIHWWYLNPGDVFVSGDFDDDGQDELLAVAENGWSQLMKYDGSSWQTPWANEGSGTIHWWYLNPGDMFVSGDFDDESQDELLAIAENGWSHMMEYTFLPDHPTNAKYI
jgi:hypothetical protein